MYRARKYRLCPDEEQRELCAKFFGACRVVKNLVVEQNNLTHAMGFGFTNRSKIQAELKELRNDPAVAPWLRNVPAQILQSAIADTLVAYQRFFAGESSYPNFRKRISRQAFRVPQHVSITRTSKRWGLVKLQGLGKVRFRWSRGLVGTIKSATVIREADGTYWVSILCEQRDRTPQLKSGEVVGVDLGIVVPVATSDGGAYRFTALKPKEKERLLRLQRQFSRQARGSRGVRQRAGK